MFFVSYQILLNTMHKYYFELLIEELSAPDSEPLVFPFNLTSFVAVTAYQSAKLTELKKEKNPFARGVKHHESETDAHPQVPPRPIYESGKLFYLCMQPIYCCMRFKAVHIN